MTIKYDLTDGEKCKRILKIEVSSDRVQEKFEETYRRLKTEAQLPGFRKGRVPMSTIKTRFREVARKDVLEELMDESYNEAISQSGLKPADYPKITEVDFGEGKSLSYIAELEVQPVINLERYTGFSLKKPDARVTVSEVEQLLNRVRREHSTLVTVDREAEEGDFVIADLEVEYDSAEKLKEQRFENVQLELVKGTVASQFTDQLLGVRAGEERIVRVEYPLDHFDKRFSGSNVRFKARVSAVKQLELAELNTDLFREFGESIETLDQFKDILRADLEARKTKESNDALREEVIKEIIDKNRFDLPEAMVNRYLDEIIKDIHKNYREGSYDEETVRRDYRPLAIRRMRWDLLCTKVAETEGISVEQSDIEEWVRRFAERYRMSFDEALKTLQRNRRIADIKETILENKVLDYIIANSTVETIQSTRLEPN